MANHVTNSIVIRYGADREGIVSDIVDKIAIEGNVHCVYDQWEDTREWYEDHIGSKWVRLNDVPYCDEKEANLYFESAWDEIDPFVRHLCDIIGECEIEHSFMDEMPNFGGTRKYVNGELVAENYVGNLWDLIEGEVKRRMKEENLSFPNESQYDDWKWDWMWDFVDDVTSLSE